MRTATANPAMLLRCADAAGYGAVSFEQDDAPVQRRVKSRRGFWRAFLSVFFVIV
ncbi:MAG: hypothetical protein V9G24_16885 [Rhodoblastus sp.]